MRRDRAPSRVQMAILKISYIKPRRPSRPCALAIASALLAWLAADPFLPGQPSESFRAVGALGRAAAAAELAQATPEDQAVRPDGGAPQRATEQAPLRIEGDKALARPQGEAGSALGFGTVASEAASASPGTPVSVAGQASPAVDTGTRLPAGEVRIEPAGTPLWATLAIVAALLINAILFACTGWLIRNSFANVARNERLGLGQTAPRAAMPEPLEPADEILHHARATIFNLEQKLSSIGNDLAELRGLLLERTGIGSQDHEIEQQDYDQERVHDQHYADQRGTGVQDQAPATVADDADYAGGRAVPAQGYTLDETDEERYQDTFQSPARRHIEPKTWSGPRHFGLDQLKTYLSAFDIGYEALLSGDLSIEPKDWHVARVRLPGQSDRFLIETFDDRSQIVADDEVFVAIGRSWNGRDYFELYPCKEKWKKAVPTGILEKIFGYPADLEQLSKVVEPATLRNDESTANPVQYELVSKGRLE